MQRQRLVLFTEMVNCEESNHSCHPEEGQPEDKADPCRGKQGSGNPEETVTEESPAPAESELPAPLHVSVIQQ